MNTSPAKTRRVSPASALAAICAVPLVAAPLVLAVTPAAQASVSSVALNNRVLTVQANNTPTSVRIQHSGANTVVTQAGVNGSWTYPTANVQRVVFNGGSDNDSFDATGLTLPVLAKGNGGNDQLTGGNSRDTLVGAAGTDTLNGGPEDDTLVTIDTRTDDSANGGSGRDTYWRDSVNGSYDSANVAADDFDNRVAAFANGADRTLNGDDIFDPTAPVGAWYVDQPNRPLFATSGPSGSDIFQGPISDCKVVSSLSAIAHNTPGGDAFPIRRAMADFGDGTFGVRLNGRFYRVDNQLVQKFDGTMISAGPGAQNSMWVGIAEKALALHDSVEPGSPYLRLTSTSPATIFDAFGSETFATPLIRGEFASSAADLGNKLFAKWNHYDNVVLTLTPPVSTVNGVHAYTLWNVNRNAAGTVTSLQLRNPYGNADGGANGYSDANANDAMVTLTPAQVFADTQGRVNWGTAS
ncbi:MAG: C2 family cysteine protease [Candidatus Nanopelagicales bacterium]